MQSLEARLDSFLKKKRIKKTPNKPSSVTATLKWPHPPTFKATAGALSEAGFFYSPSWDDRDSVACFMCGKELGEWDVDDDPFEIHYAKGKNCPWAIVRCGLREDVDEDGNYVFPNKSRLPSSKVMEKARLETFTAGDWWPHDAVSVHGASSKKMAQAGFVCTPQGAGDDTATCLYCNLALSGWDKDDDPLDEHRKRRSKSDLQCPFFAGPPAPASKASAPSRATLGRSTSIKGGRARAVSRTRSKAKESFMVEESSQASDDELATVARAPSRTRSKAKASAIVEEPKQDFDDEHTTAVKAVSRTRSKAKASAVVEESKQPSDDELTTAVKAVSRTRSKAKASAVVEEQSQACDDQLVTTVGDPSHAHRKAKETVVVEEQIQASGDELADAVSAPRPKAKALEVAEEPTQAPSNELTTILEIPDSALASPKRISKRSTTPIADIPYTTTPPSTPPRYIYNPREPPQSRNTPPAPVPPPEVPKVRISTHETGDRVNQAFQSQTTKHVTHADVVGNDRRNDTEPNPFLDINCEIPPPSFILTEEERTMTVEQWIQHEIMIHSERIRADGLAQITLFKQRAEEVRRAIAAL